MDQAKPGRWNRREWLKRAATAAGTFAAPWAIRSSALGKDGTVAPSERITLGFIGIGAMGRGHLRRLLTYAQAQVLAVCDVRHGDGGQGRQRHLL